MSKELTISNLDQHLKPLQIDSVTTPIELSTEAIRMNKDITLMKDLIIEGDLSVLGTQSHIEMTNGVSINTVLKHKGRIAKILKEYSNKVKTNS